MIHLAKEITSEHKVAACGLDLGRKAKAGVDYTIWWTDSSCPECLARMRDPFITTRKA